MHLERELYPLGWIHTHPTQVFSYLAEHVNILRTQSSSGLIFAPPYVSHQSSHPAAFHSLTHHLLLPYTLQTCFLSSVDVHTQSGYQTMLDEAVAIVMAPTDRAKRCGIFRLTTPGGLSLVQRCDRRGFHMHPETGTGQEVYELCGHVYLNGRVQHEVVDLR